MGAEIFVKCGQDGILWVNFYVSVIGECIMRKAVKGAIR